MKNYSIKCDCGHVSESATRRSVEAKAWHHAIHNHADIVNNLSPEQLTGIMEGWDKTYVAQEK